MNAQSIVLSLAFASIALSQPGPLPPQAKPGNPVPGLTKSELAFFTAGLDRFNEVDSVTGTEPGAAGVGLGARFNMNSCAGCHAQPATGGSSPKVNPQVAVATRYGATNALPPFISANGPVRVARFVKNADGTPDGGVHDLFVITGRVDAKGCSIAQPDFNAAQHQNNLSLRIPTPVFGAGLMEAIPDAAILAYKTSNGPLKKQLGIAGHENRNGNDGTITRFGWKAQNVSLTVFAGEAYNVEQGVSNEVFPIERDQTPGCVFNGSPEDTTHPDAATVLDSMSDVTGLAAFMKYLAPMQAAPENPSIRNGRAAFGQIGCALCHTPMMQTGKSNSAALTNQPVALYSDLIVHKMGEKLEDGVAQGSAQGDEWRTAPLWGLGSRLFYLHDGRSTDLVDAIHQHQSNGSEANRVIGNFDALRPQDRQDLLNFLKSL